VILLGQLPIRLQAGWQTRAPGIAAAASAAGTHNQLG
jgi:hypothetical protein